MVLFFFFQAEDGIRDLTVTGVQTCALPIYERTELRPGEPELGDEERAHGGDGLELVAHRRARDEHDRERDPAVVHVPRRPPLTAGRIEISAPSGTGVARPPLHRLLSVPTKTFTCGRTSPCSVSTRSRMPG